MTIFSHIHTKLRLPSQICQIKSATNIPSKLIFEEQLLLLKTPRLQIYVLNQSGNP